MVLRRSPSSSVGWCCLVSSFGVVLLFSFSFWWGCLPSPPSGGATFSPFFCWVVLLGHFPSGRRKPRQHHAKGEGKRNTTQQKEETKQHHPTEDMGKSSPTQRRRRKTTPLNRRRKNSNTTQRRNKEGT